MKYPKSIWTFPKPHPSIAIHPTQKPLELCRYAIRTYSNEGDIVLDYCCGSGTIPLAAKIENRRYIGMDNDICTKKGKYYGQFWSAIAAERISSYE